ncbi:MAG: PhoX family protein [Methyloligella sp. ZOD6]
MAGDGRYCNRAEAFEAHDDIPRSPESNESLGEVVARRYSRRDVMRGSLGVAVATALFGRQALTSAAAHPAPAPSRFDFEEVSAGIDERSHVAEGYRAQILLRWGDPLFPDSPAFDPLNQSAEAQLKQFGYNNDYIGFFPLNDAGSRALLCVNHEYTSEEVMFPNLPRQDQDAFFRDMTQELAEIEMAAHGVTIVAIEKVGADWMPQLDSPYNRRISPLTTEMTVDGPAAGHARLKTSADPHGNCILGTLNNCAGGVTPWGTYLTAEENFHGYFWTDERNAEGKPAAGLGGDQAKSYERYDVPAMWWSWGKFHDRFNVDREPNEPNRFGWICEIDPFDSTSTPVKHTALGRYRHEGAECILNKDGHAVVYSGDDGKFDYVYRFVSAGTYDPDDRAANMQLLSDGTLSVARFHADGTLHWLPLVHGQNGLTAENGFASQADVMIDARLAADRVGATRMDRPEDIQPNEVNGRVYLMLTNNNKRGAGETDAANPRPENLFGHIIEMVPPDGDHGADRYRWSLLVKCGNPYIAEVGALWGPDVTESGWFASPDNAAVDADGRLWVATDQGENWKATGKADGLYGLETDGPGKRNAKLFFRCPVGAELCGPCFTPDQETAFVAVQHPGTDATEDYEPFGRASTFEDPATRWPDFQDGMPPRPSLVAITKIGGGKIG